MAARPRKSSARVTLVLLGAAALAGCGDAPPESRRDLYATREDCVADWGEPKDCDEQQVRDGDRVTHRYWYGPSYSPHGFGSTTSGVGNSHLGSRAVGSTSVARGGFGASGHAHGAAAS
jgi:hypothetical protein